jgi:hypothetical protein
MDLEFFRVMMKKGKVLSFVPSTVYEPVNKLTKGVMLTALG